MALRMDTRRPYDLGAAILLSVLALVVNLLGMAAWLRVLFGLVFVLLAPGYALLSWLFPRRETVVIRGVERPPIPVIGWFALSVALSIALASLVGLALNFIPDGLKPGPFLASLSILTVVAAAGAIVRRAEVPADQAFRLRFQTSDAPRERRDRVVTVLVVVSLAMVAAAGLWVLLGPKQDERFSEFYLLGASGEASCYPALGNSTTYRVSRTDGCPPGQLGNLTPGRVTVGIVNREGRTMDYWVRVVWTEEPLDGGQRSIQSVEVLDEWQVTLPSVPVSLELGTLFEPQYETNLTVPPAPGVGTWRLSFQLYKQAPPEAAPDEAYLATAYKRTHLWIERIA